MTKKINAAKEQYAFLGVDVDKALQLIANIPVSIHCWQGDDVLGFESSATALDGGIQVTGSHPGKARNIKELRTDLSFVCKLVPGLKKVNLHAIYRDAEENVERVDVMPKHFESWVQWGKENLLYGLDFNPTVFSHPLSKDGFTLSHADSNIRDYWIEHCKNSRQISAYFAESFGTASVNNIWIPDGFKDISYGRLEYRTRLLESLDKIFKEKTSVNQVDAVESKLFGIGSEASVIGSHEFYMGYASSRNIALCVDMGHFHPTESIADKVSSLSLYISQLLFHISRPMRWDSDHTVLFDDATKELFLEIARLNDWDRIFIGTDFFDASINRIVAWVIGLRNVQKSLLFALLEPQNLIKKVEQNGDFSQRLVVFEQIKTLPFGDIWDYYCASNNIPTEAEVWSCIENYTKQELSKRN